jgi:AAA domain-containing protein
VTTQSRASRPTPRPIAPAQRFSRDNPCPICAGHPGRPRGKGERCHGFLSSNGRFAHCTREDRAGGLPMDGAGTFPHLLEGLCRCGETHGSESLSPKRVASRSIAPPRTPRILSDGHFKDCEAGSPWDYVDATGTVLYRKCRYAGKRFAFYHPNGTGWAEGRGTSSVLLDLPLVGQAIAAGRTVFLVEGEKKARELQRFGVAATTNDAGALGLTPELAEGLRGAPRVVIVLDNDLDGRKRGERLPSLLHAVGVLEIRVLLISELGEGEGIDDWLARMPADVDVDERRARLEGLAEAAPQWRPAAAASRRRSPWDAIESASDFLSSPEPDDDFLEPRLLARGSLTQWNSPRGLGKTHAAHALAVKQAKEGRRVLLIDRDNSRRELKRRLRGWGAAGVASLKVLGRDEAPPLTDHVAWGEFPFADYDLVVIDALDSSTEGVGEQDSGRASLALAPLLDLVHTAGGPAVLLLANTLKSGSHGRGSGIIEDRGDIVYEVRDATDLRPSGTLEWWKALPPADRGSWADRATRRKRRDAYRLAFVSSKYRIGEEPDPFVFEVSLNPEPWTFREVTAILVATGQAAGEPAARAKAAAIDESAGALAVEVATRAATGAPVRARNEAVTFLVGRGLSRDAARSLIADRVGRDWRLAGGARRGDPVILLPPGITLSEGGTAGIQGAESQRQTRSGVVPIPAAQESCGPPETDTAMTAPVAVENDPAFRRTTPTTEEGRGAAATTEADLTDEQMGALAACDCAPAPGVAWPDDAADFGLGGEVDRRVDHRGPLSQASPFGPDGGAGD